MGTIHFLNVEDGDCSIIEHTSGRKSVIDICSGNMVEKSNQDNIKLIIESLQGNYGQKKHPTNPICYLKEMKVESIFRFILTHPDMDHMDGLARLCDEFIIENFWDTDNKKEKPSFEGGHYKERDWDKYQKLRKNALNLYDGASGVYYNCDDDYGEGDCLQILCPTKELMEEANEKGDYNNASYVILYNEAGRKILFSGDAEEKEWDVLLENHESDLTDIDVLIAPHHGRKSGGNDKFLDVLKPKLTLFGNAKSKDLNYNAWLRRNLKHYTNNEGENFIMKVSMYCIDLYCTNGTFASKMNQDTWFDDSVNAWFMEVIA